MKITAETKIFITNFVDIRVFVESLTSWIQSADL